MSYAPATLLELRSYLAATAGVGLDQFGIVGNTAHARGYHLGRDRIYSSTGAGDADYSVRTARDRAGLTNAASALDMKLPALTLRAYSTWLVERRCRTGLAPDVREVIWSPDGAIVLRWDRERGIDSAPQPGEADSSHLWHTHVSFYRDAEARDHRGPFRGYFEGDDDMATIVRVKAEAWHAAGLNGVGRTEPRRGAPVAVRLPENGPLITAAEVLTVDLANAHWRLTTLGAYRAGGATIVETALAAAPDGTPVYALRPDLIPAVPGGDPVLDGRLADLLAGATPEVRAVTVRGVDLVVEGP